MSEGKKLVRGIGVTLAVYAEPGCRKNTDKAELEERNNRLCFAGCVANTVFLSVLSCLLSAYDTDTQNCNEF